MRRCMGLKTDEPLPLGWFYPGVTVIYLIEQKEGKTCIINRKSIY